MELAENVRWVQGAVQVQQAQVPFAEGGKKRYFFH
jgi:hypothetical protein